MRRVNACPHPRASLTHVASLHDHTYTPTHTVAQSEGGLIQPLYFAGINTMSYGFVAPKGEDGKRGVNVCAALCHVTVQWLPSSHRTEVQRHTTQVVLWCGALSSATLYSRLVAPCKHAP